MNYLIVFLFLCLTLFGIEPKDENCLNSLNGKYYGKSFGFEPCYAHSHFGTVGIATSENELYKGQWEYGNFDEQGILELKESSKYLDQFIDFGQWVYILSGFFDEHGSLKYSCPDNVCQTNKVKDNLPSINGNIFNRYHIVPQKLTYAEFAENNQLEIEDTNDSSLIFKTLYISDNEDKLIKSFEHYSLKKYIVKGIWKNGSLIVSVDNFFDNYYSKYPKKLGKKSPAIKIDNQKIIEQVKRMNTIIPCTANELQYNPYEADNNGRCFKQNLPSKYRTYPL